jgi:ABC-type multidrug transport system ATPase subunit
MISCGGMVALSLAVLALTAVMTTPTAAAASSPAAAGCPPPAGLRFDVDSAASSFSITGQSAYSKVAQGKTSFPVTQQKPPVPLTLQGALWGGLVSAGGEGGGNDPCPTDAEGWRAALPRLRLASGPSAYAFEPLRLSPPSLYLSVFGVPLNISGLEYNLTLSGAEALSSPPPPRPPADNALSVSATQLGAYVFSNTTLTGGAKLDPMGGEKTAALTRAVKVEVMEGEEGGDATAAAATTGSSSSASPSVVVLTIPGFNLTFASNTSGSSVAGEGYGTLRTTLNGTLVLRALLPGAAACPEGGCGPYGRCVAGVGGGTLPAAASKNTTTTSTATGRCECQCGWAVSPKTGRCEVPGGATCPLYPSGFGGAFAARAAAAGARGGDPDACAGVGGLDSVASALALRGACPQGYGYDVAQQQCERCPTGFGGAGCNTCSGDAACRSLPGASPTVTCSSGIAYDERSGRKHYTCAVVPEDIVKVVGPTLSFFCDTGSGGRGGGDAGDSSSSSSFSSSSSSSPSSSSSSPSTAAASAVDASALAARAAEKGFCQIQLRLGDMPKGQLALCRATGCHFAAGRSSWVCDSVSCGCPDGCTADGQDFRATFEGISGKATLDCEADGGLDGGASGGGGGGSGGGGAPPKQTGLAAALSGGSGSSGAGKCALGVGSLNVQLDLDCQAAECLDPESAPRLGSELPSQRDVKAALAPAVAAVPSFALLLGAGVCSALALRALPFVRATKPGGAGGVAAGGKGGKGGGAAGGRPVAEAVEEEEHRAAAAPAAAPAAAAASAPVPSLPGLPALHEESFGGPADGGCSLRELRFEDVDVWVHGKAAAALAASAAAASASASCGGGGGNGLAALPPPPPPPRRSLAARLRISRKPTVNSACSAATDTEAGYGGGGGGRGGTSGGGGPLGGSTAGGAGLPGGGGDPDDKNNDNDAWMHRAPPPPRGKGWRQVLRGVTGSLRAGEMTGVMGPSGSGKSTLLHVLTGALAGGGAGGNHWRVRGRVLADGVRVGPGRLSRLTALVPQDDLLVRSLTVEESLYYSAALRLDASLSPAQCRARVDAVLRDLGLDKVRRSTVLSGATGRAGISGGERRRVAIGMELLTKPGALVLDEPCSGLDAFTAVQLMRTLRRVATEGKRALALSLHQPSPVMYALLDRAVLVAGGRLVYSGPPQGAADALAALGAPCPQGVPLAEHLLFAVSDPALAGRVIDAAAARADAERAERRMRRDEAAGLGGEDDEVAARRRQEERGEDEQARAEVFPPADAKPLSLPPPPHPPQHAQPRRPGTARQLGVLFWRSLLDVFRNPMLAGLHSAGGLVLGIVVGVIFLRVSNDTAGAQNRVGAMFFALCLLAFTSVTTVDLLQQERQAVQKEVQRRYYSSGIYCLAKLLVDGLALRALPALLFSVPFFFLMGLVPLASNFFTFLFVVIAFSCAVGALAMAFAALTDSPGKAAMLTNVVLLFGVLFAGFLANKSAIPPVLRWITYLSVFRYSWEALVISEMVNLSLYFTAPGIDITVRVAGDSFLQIIGVDSAMLLPDVAVLVAIWMLCVAFAFWAVWWRYGRRADVSGDRKERRRLETATRQRQRRGLEQEKQQQQGRDGGALPQAAAATAATVLA